MIAHNYIYHYQEPKTAGSVPLADAPDDTSGPTAKPREGDAAAAGGGAAAQTPTEPRG